MSEPNQDNLIARLQPDLIYRFNQTFLTAWKQGDIRKIDQDNKADEDDKNAIPFTLSYFNSHTRTFNWVSIGEELWDRKSDEWKEKENNHC